MYQAMNNSIKQTKEENMGLFDKVFNKKNEEPKKDGNLIMSMPMFASEKRVLPK